MSNDTGEIRNIAEEQGWSDTTLLDLLEHCIHTLGFSDKVIERLQLIADEENREEQVLAGEVISNMEPVKPVEKPLSIMKLMQDNPARKGSTPEQVIPEEVMDGIFGGLVKCSRNLWLTYVAIVADYYKVDRDGTDKHAQVILAASLNKR